MSTEEKANEFENLAKEKESSNLLKEYIAFLKHNKKWWLIPIVVMMTLLGAFIFLAGTSVAPFIYTLF